jgi:hypothetical protein
LIEPFWPDAAVRQGTHAGNLLAEVIELEDDRVTLPAIHARSRSQILEHVRLRSQSAALERVSGLLSVKIAALQEVLARATPASVLPLAPGAAERHVGQKPSAAITTPDGGRRPHGQAAAWDLSSRDGACSLQERRRAGDVTNPDTDRGQSDVQLARYSSQGSSASPHGTCEFLLPMLRQHERMFPSSPDGTVDRVRRYGSAT